MKFSLRDILRRPSKETKIDLNKIIPVDFGTRPKAEKKLDKPDEEFQNGVNNMIIELEKIYNEFKKNNNVKDTKQFREDFFYHLNKSGEYLKLKESLKHGVYYIAKEIKTNKTEQTKNSKFFKKNSLLSPLHDELISNCNIVLNKFIKEKQTLNFLKENPEKRKTNELCEKKMNLAFQLEEIT
eukprot:UN27759